MSHHKMSSSEFINYLKQFSCFGDESKESTHTRISDKMNIKGGSYHIPNEKEIDFYKSYYNNVFVNKNKEYLTEKQREEGPILIDFDFRYDKSIKERQHNKEDILNFIELLTETLKNILNFDTKIFQIYVFEKPKVNCLEDVTKDGIHMLINISMHMKYKLYLRDLLLSKISDYLSLPITNSWSGVLDEGIFKGTTNWQLYGSRKPAHDSYILTHHFDLKFDTKDSEFEVSENENIYLFDLKQRFKELTARSCSLVTFDFKPEVVEKCNNLVPKTRKKNNKLKLKNSSFGDQLSMDDIRNQEDIDRFIENQMTNLQPTEFIIKEVHQFVMILPELYYGAGSYDKWIRVGWALKNTDSRLFLTWLKFSSQSNEFSYDSIGELYSMWKDFESSNPDGLTNRSIMYWAKNDGPIAKYNKIKNETVEHLMTITVEKGATDFDLANVLYHLFNDRFICTDVKNNEWYEYKGHKWVEINSGSALRLLISKDLHNVYANKVIAYVNELQSTDERETDKWNFMQSQCQIMSCICQRLKKTTDKNNIMREAKELFYAHGGDEFNNKKDENPYLMCFNNGVFDFESGIFRDGRPEDYITMSTNINYIPIEKVNKKHLNEVQNFMCQLFPNEELRNYMWKHLASTLIGTNDNQSFNIYTGSGRNGKSKLVELMSKLLGDYKGTVPITLITQKRTSIGSSTPEIAKLKGKRYAVMQEPSKKERINEGIMKEITGGDTIQGRALFKDSIEFVPQFKLVVTCNSLFDITSNDDGTWRRIRLCDFVSLFTEHPKEGDEDQPFQFKVDKKLDKKFDVWKYPFMSKLIEIAKTEKGNVDDCDIVMAKSNAYRENQDYMAEFIREKVEAFEGGKIKKGEIYETFKNWYTLQYGRGVPKGKEVYDSMDKKYGKYTAGGWHNVRIVYETEE